MKKLTELIKEITIMNNIEHPAILTIKDFKDYIEKNNISDDTKIFQIHFIGLFSKTFLRIDSYNSENKELLFCEH